MHAHISLKRHHNPNKKGLLCPKSKASGPRWRGRSAWMREPFAIGHSRPCDGSHLTAISQPFSRPASKTSNNTPIPSKRHPNPTKKGLLCPKSKASTPGMAWTIRMDAGILCDRAQQAFRQLPTHSHQPFSRPASKTSNNTPIPSKRHHNPNKKGLLCPKSKASGPRWRGRSAWMRESFAIGHSGPFGGSQLTATSNQQPASSPKLPAPSPSHKKNGRPGFP